MPPSDRPVLLNDPDHYVHPRLHTFQPLVGGADRVTSAVLYNVATQEGRSLDPVAALKLLETSRSKHIPFVMSLSCHEKHDFFKLPPEVDYYSFPLSKTCTHCCGASSLFTFDIDVRLRCSQVRRQGAVPSASRHPPCSQLVTAESTSSL